jgi:proteic killer suppression protein
MIVSFKHKGLKRLYEKGDAKYVPREHLAKINDILSTLDAAMSIDDMELITFRLHTLTGKRKDTWSVTVRANWRITFRFENGKAFDVDYEDYH